MNTLENTVSMMKALPETDLVKIQDFTRKLSRHQELEVADEAVGEFLKPMSQEDFMRDIEAADKHLAQILRYIRQDLGNEQAARSVATMY